MDNFSLNGKLGKFFPVFFIPIVSYSL